MRFIFCFKKWSTLASDLQNPWSGLELTDVNAGRNLTEGGGGESLRDNFKIRHVFLNSL